jgi:hypothetical protein
MGNNRGGRRLKLRRQQVPDPDQNTNEVSAGYQQVQEFLGYPTGEFRPKRVSGKIDACQNAKTQGDPECGATPRHSQEARKEQQGKEQAALNDSRSPVDHGYTSNPPDAIVRGRIHSEQNTNYKQQTCYAL